MKDLLDIIITFLLWYFKDITGQSCRRSDRIVWDYLHVYIMWWGLAATNTGGGEREEKSPFLSSPLLHKSKMKKRSLENAVAEIKSLFLLALT